MSRYCPVCGAINFDGIKCDECNYAFDIKYLVSTHKTPDVVHQDTSVPDNQAPSLEYFETSTDCISLKKLRAGDIPRSPGVYGWYFDSVPPYVPVEGCTEVRYKSGWFFTRRYHLLYIGNARNLRSRIYNYHIQGKYYEGDISSLRLSLGCLFSAKWKMYLELNSDYKQSFGRAGDEKLTLWLIDHAVLKWIETEDYDEVEKQFIHYYVLPLNAKYNNHPFSKIKDSPLYNLKDKYKKLAESNNARKNEYHKAYKEFIEECKYLG